MNTRSRILILITASLLFALRSIGWKKDTTHNNRKSPSNKYVNAPQIIHPDHIIFLWMENKDLDSIIGNNNAPFINSLLKKGTLFTNAHAITHPSYPNYVDFFAGDPNGVRDDACLDSTHLSTPNLYTTLKAVHKSFAWYSEDLPENGSRVCAANLYAAKHNPTTLFKNVPRRANKRFADLPSNYNNLENVVCISPNLIHDMHSASIQEGDEWVRKNLGSLINWCTTHNSIFIVYFDESGNNQDNRIPVVAVGKQVQANFKTDAFYDHFSWTKTVSAMFLAPDSWTPNVSNAKLVTDCWK
ncbi:MAG: alkaline phosphatase family protein [Bacteroidota bacterium]|nr:alkaline phosphatase family protein [Bacteroidota bacterium]